MRAGELLEHTLLGSLAYSVEAGCLRCLLASAHAWLAALCDAFLKIHHTTLHLIGGLRYLLASVRAWMAEAADNSLTSTCTHNILA